MSLKQLFKDFINIHEFLPTSIKIYQNNEEGISKGEIIQPKSRYGPERIRWFDDDKKGIHYFETGENKKVENKRKMIEW